VRRLFWLIFGVWGGFMGAAAVVKRVLPSRGDADSDEVALVAVFDGRVLRSEAKHFRGGSMFAWYGGIDVDLRGAELAADGARLSVGALFGGVSIRVPPGWRVEKTMRAVAGGVEVSGEDPADPDAPLLVIDGYALFGGVSVSRKKPEDTA
jgi:hypothetical protein